MIAMDLLSVFAGQMPQYVCHCENEKANANDGIAKGIQSE